MVSKHKKERKQSQAEHKRSQRDQFPTSPQKMSFIQSLWSIILLLLKLIGILAAIVSLYSFTFTRISVRPSVTVIKTNPFYTPFIIINDGYLPISNVKFSCFLRHVNASGGNKSIPKETQSIGNIFVPKLYAGQSASMSYKFIINPEATIISAEIDVIVTYKSLLMPFTSSYSQGFKAIHNLNGELIWTPIPPSEKFRGF